MTDHIKKLADARAKIKAKDEEIERLKGVHRAWINEDQASAELATAREQVRVLREALAVAADAFRDYTTKHFLKMTPEADIKANENLELAQRMEAALAATEPKG